MMIKMLLTVDAVAVVFKKVRPSYEMRRTKLLCKIVLLGDVAMEFLNPENSRLICKLIKLAPFSRGYSFAVAS